jgi:uncharacterized protein (TIGR03067 family)
VLLCYLENRTHLEAAQELRCPIGTVKGRLSRALETLRSRLARRGLVLSTSVVATALAASAAEAAVPATLLDSTVRLSLRLVKGKAALEQIAPPQVAALIAALSKGTKARSWLPRLLRWACVPVALVLIGTAALWISGGTGGGKGEGTSPAYIAKVGAAAKGVPLAPAPDDKTLLEGTWRPIAAYRGGQALPKMPPETRFIFSGDRLTAKLPGMAITDYSFSLDPGAKPKAMDLTVLTKPLAGAVFLAVYELDGDILKLCMPDAGQRPAEVASKPNTGHILMVLQRQPK